MNLTLIALVPLLVVPVVGLLAFAGCGRFGAADPPPKPDDGPRNGGGNGDKGLDRYRNAVVHGPNEGLVAYWTLSDPTGSTAVDLGPSHLDGAYTGSPGPIRATAGGALSPLATDVCTRFAADGGRMQVPFQLLLNPASNLRFSVEVWVRLQHPEQRPGDIETLASGRAKDADGDTTGWELTVEYGDDGTPTFIARVYAGDGGDSTRTSVEVGAGAASLTAWHLVVLTFDGSGGGAVSVHVRVAGDATPHHATRAPAPYQSTTDTDAPLSFGGRSGSDAAQFTGDLDEAAFYNTALTATQVQRHADAAR